MGVVVERGTGIVRADVKGHGLFRTKVALYNQMMTRTRDTLIEAAVEVYEGASGLGSFGDKKSHWKGISKEEIAVIVADSLGGGL